LSSVAAGPPEVMFYHLERIGLEGALTPLLEKSRERGWRALVRGAQPQRLELLDAHLWTYRDDSFLAHGLDSDGDATRHPILLTVQSGANPNQAQVLFCIDGADFAPDERFLRICVVFDGSDSAALTHARSQWKAVKAAGLAATYWKQSEAGGWSKQA
jgi:DNA polymerase III subunit chi